MSLATIRFLCCSGISALLLLNVTHAGPKPVALLRTPQGGIQPQALMDRQGTLHLIYFQGDPKGGNIYYAKRPAGQGTFSESSRVNTHDNSAIAIGTIRGPHLALGRSGRVHVVWNGSSEAPKPSHPGAPLFYTRLNDRATAFEPERDMITFAAGLDGGSSVAADDQGRVYVVWHAPAPGEAEGEDGRAVFVARSQDDGKVFSKEFQANPEPTGACGCCGLRAFADESGILHILYRGASKSVNRDELLLVSKNLGNDFAIVPIHPWNIASCPMSSAFLSEGSGQILAAWETAGQVYFTALNPATLERSESIHPPGAGKRKHPLIVANSHGEKLLAWAEGTGWNRGGTLAWQVYDQTNQPTSERGTGQGLPAWSLPTAIANPDGSFLIIY